MEKTEEIGEQQRREFLGQAIEEINNTVYPAYLAYIDYFTALRGKSTTDAGVWKFPDGREFYDYMLQVNTTTNMTADEIHRLGLEEVDRIQGEMMDIFAAERYDVSRGFSVLIADIAGEDRFYYSDTDEGRDQILADYVAIIEEIDAGLSEAFKSKPRAAVEVNRVPEFSEKTSAGRLLQWPIHGWLAPGNFLRQPVRHQGDTKVRYAHAGLP